jgi:proteasome lid subunit RPN8/RPN11
VEVLRECARRVDFTHDWRERMAYLMGEARGSQRIVQEVVEVPSEGGFPSVSDLPQSLSRLLAATQDDPLVVGIAHSHPEWYPAPSLRDWETQAWLELHYDLIGLIFGFGGDLRFYRIRPYEVEIQGEGIEEVRSGAVYRLLPLPRTRDR